ncbi:MAG: hypothetical protein KAT77_05410 [Nanoarchaeota archaeon]|nr:hypothetical protein [Nanoarchaeota archaeon]
MTEIKSNSANLLISPPLAGKLIFLDQQISNFLKNKQPLLYITTDKSPEDIKKRWLKNKFFYGSYEQLNFLKFVDAFSYQTGNLTDSTNSIKRVSGPVALNEISVALAETQRDLYKINPNHLVIFDSLSTLLMYTNPATVGRFTQVITAKIKQAGGTIIYTLEQGMHDQKTIITIEHLMDQIIQIKQEKNKHFIKTQNIDWQPFD